MGGNISTKSSTFIRQMYEKGILDKIETRNVVIELNSQNVADIESLIRRVLMFEIEWLQYKAKYYNNIGDSYKDRIQVLKQRV